MTDIESLWMVVRTDLLGNTYLMQDGLSEQAAQKFIQSILDRQRKKHGQEYDLHNYTPSTKAQRFLELRIIIP